MTQPAARQEQVHRFGVVPPQSEQTHRFTLANRSSFSWTIAEVRAACTCTVAELSQRVIAPGESATLVVEYTAGSRTGDERRTIDLRFKEPEAPLITLAVEAEVREPLTVSPWEVSLRGDTASGASLNVYNYSSNDWSGLRAESSSTWLAIEVVPVPLASSRSKSDPRQAWRVLLHPDSESLKPGPHAAHIRFRPEDRAEPFGAGLVTLRIEPPLRVSPPVLFYGEIAAKESAERTLRVSMPKASVAGAEMSLCFRHDLQGQLSVTAEPGTQLGSWMLTVTLCPDGMSRTINGTLTVIGSEGAKVEIPVRSLVRQEGRAIASRKELP